jgi:hypothetical protein
MALLGAVDLQRNTTADRPGREDQVGVTDRVVGVKMGSERDAQPGWFERLDTLSRNAMLARRTTPGPKSTR